MAVRIRLRRMGAKKRPFYRFVAADSRSPRDGRFIEILGYYNPIEKPAKVVVQEDKVFKWLQNGAQMTETVATLFKKINVLDKWEKIKAGESGDDIQVKDTIEERKKRTRRAKKASASEEEAEAKAEEGKSAETEEAKEE
ncbi:MAG: 30S ribosomal protein S16 [candidate division Zixibacteria bacterium]|nr:30S ribosomal protein S16 [candidate division Zixibacteria bacterium]